MTIGKRVFLALVGAGLGAAALGGFGRATGLALAQSQPEWHNCLTREVFTPEKQAWCDRWSTLQNGTYLVPTGFGPEPEYLSIALEWGEYNRAEELLVGLANEPNWLTFGDIDGDGKTDAAVILGVAEGGSSNLATYVVAVMDIDGQAEALRPVVLGDRILLNGPMTIEDQRLTVPQLTQTEVINRSFVIDGTSLSELAQRPGPVSPSAPDGTIVLSQTATYAVRVFTQAGQPRINLFNKSTGRQVLSAAQAIAESSVEGLSFTHSGSIANGHPSVRVSIAPDGSQVFEVNDTVQTNAASVTGTVSYLPRIALPPSAILEVTLVEISRADAPAITLAAQGAIFGERQVPIAFELMYDPAQIDPRSSYAVQARITVDGQLRFTTTSRFAVITQGNPSDLEVRVDPVAP